MRTRKRRLAPTLDALCVLAFVLVGRDRHDIDEGVDWFVTVLWPLVLGWLVVALATRLYIRRSGQWLALAVTVVGGILVAAVLRGAFTDRPYFGIFTVVATGFIGATAFGWRAIAAVLARRRPNALDPA